RKSGGSGTNNGDILSGPYCRNLRFDPAFAKRAVDDRDLDLFDCDGIGVDAEDARAFARRRANPSCELREVVGREQAADRLLPAVAINEIVPVGNNISERTALMTERHTAIHAA